MNRGQYISIAKRCISSLLPFFSAARTSWRQPRKLPRLRYTIVDGSLGRLELAQKIAATMFAQTAFGLALKITSSHSASLIVASNAASSAIEGT